MRQSYMKEISRAYKAGELSEEEIKAIEKANKCPIEEVVAFIDKIFYVKKHNLKTMTITDIRKWLAKKKISEEEKQQYAEANKCTYEEALLQAKKRLEEFDIQQEFKYLDSLYGLTEETREKRRKSMQELVDRGYAERTSDDNVVVMKGDNFVRYFKDKANKRI